MKTHWLLLVRGVQRVLQVLLALVQVVLMLLLQLTEPRAQQKKTYQLLEVRWAVSQRKQRAVVQLAW
jgi:hypothetical protein